MTGEKSAVSQLATADGMLMVSAMDLTDYYVTVCSVCRCASCWHGEFFCKDSSIANVVDVLASVLRREYREHPSHYTEGKLMEVCGQVRYAP